MSQNIELVIFDWDGTLFDSVGQIVASLQYAAQQFEQPLTSEAAKSIIGLGLPEVMQILFPQVPDLQQDILQCYADHYVANSKGDAWFSGVAELLADLKQQGLKLAVATGKSRKGLDRVLTQTHSHEIFDITRAASETKSKPDPLMLQEILAELDVAVECAIMVGDTSYDLEMARNLNMPRIGVSYGVHSIETLQQYQPLTIAHNVQDLHAYLQSILERAAITES
ncbi:HAD-IA family hydrolase [Acinetobacter sp. ANC 4805]|uniref:HAD-IA family hydrolase n=1 Tax=Acinetobacter sp. ANC 4805 TaxID=2923425 RepID=UPI001F4A48C4|nr:HAD-IA family hydrolase [Acinetobacter sp. ANC 4805]MCH7311405.1 HAD-IA family hydrolase [Acinetobacter sp. ANC 4805]